MYCTITPISSMWPSTRIVGLPFGLTSAMQLPATSAVTRSANFSASPRQVRPASVSKPDGPGASSNCLRNAMASLVSIPSALVANREDDEAEQQQQETRGEPAGVVGQRIVDDAEPGDHLAQEPT